MRLFLAVTLPKAVKDQLCGVMEDLRGQIQSGRLTQRENLHLTLLFLGEVAGLDGVCRAVDAVEAQGFPLCFSKPGRFCRPDGDILWLGAAKSPALDALHRQLARALGERGISVERRAYTPHLTLGRQVTLGPGYVWEGQRVAPVEVPITRVSVMESLREGGRLCYRERYGKGLK